MIPSGATTPSPTGTNNPSPDTPTPATQQTSSSAMHSFLGYHKIRAAQPCWLYMTHRRGYIAALVTLYIKICTHQSTEVLLQHVFHTPAVCPGLRPSDTPWCGYDKQTPAIRWSSHHEHYCAICTNIMEYPLCCTSVNVTHLNKKGSHSGIITYWIVSCCTGVNVWSGGRKIKSCIQTQIRVEQVQCVPI